MKRFKAMLFITTVILILGAAASAWSSDYFGTEDFNAGKIVYNVNGSTGDQFIDWDNNVGKSWIRFWFWRVYGFRASDDDALFVRDGFCAVNGGAPCHGDIIGGHVVTNPVNIKAVHGSNDVYILPICRSHNGRGAAPMTLSRDEAAVRLRNYHR